MGVVAYPCNPITQEAKTGGSRFGVPSHPDTRVKIRMLNCFRDGELLRIQSYAPNLQVCRNLPHYELTIGVHITNNWIWLFSRGTLLGLRVGKLSGSSSNFKSRPHHSFRNVIKHICEHR